MTVLPNVWGTHSSARFQAIAFGSSIVVAVEFAPAEWKAKLLELGFCVHEGTWYRLGTLTPSEFEDLCPAITLVGFDYRFLRGGRLLSEASPISPVLMTELQNLWRRNQEAVLLELDLHGIQTVWDAADCMASAIAGEDTAPARALRKLAVLGLSARASGESLALLADGRHSRAAHGAKLIGLTGEPLDRLTKSSRETGGFLAAPLWQCDTQAWTLSGEGDLESIPVDRLLKPADAPQRLLDQPATCRQLRDHQERPNGELLKSLSSMHYGGTGVVLYFEHGRLGLCFADADGKHHSLGISCKVEDGDTPAALATAADQILEVVTRRNKVLRSVAPFLGPIGSSAQGFLAESLKGYRAVAIMRSLRDSGRGAILSDYEIEQLIGMLAEPTHSLASSTMSVARGGEFELTVGWFEGFVITSAAVRSYLQGETDNLQSTSAVVVHFSRLSSKSSGEEHEQIQYHATLEELVSSVGEDLQAGGFDPEEVRAGLWRLDRLATLPRAQEALEAVSRAEHSTLQRWVVAEIGAQLEGLPRFQELDILGIAHAAADALRGHQGLIISLPLYEGEQKLIRVPWQPRSLIQRRAALKIQSEAVGPALRLKIDAFRFADPLYCELLDSPDAEHLCDAGNLEPTNLWNGSTSHEQEEPIAGRADLWPRAELDRLVRGCSGLHRKFILGVWHGLPNSPSSADRLAIRAFSSLVAGMRRACEASLRHLHRGCRSRIETWLLNAADLVCKDLVVSQYYTSFGVYRSSLRWVPQVAVSAGAGLHHLGPVKAPLDVISDRRLTDVLLALLSHELQQACVLGGVSINSGLSAAADIIDRSGESGSIDWLWAWRACEAHLLNRVDWDLLHLAMDASRDSNVGGEWIDVREWSAQCFVAWVGTTGANPLQVPNIFFRVRRFVESIYNLLSLGTPAVICMLIGRLQQ